MSKKPRPDCLALLICEGVIEDSRSKNKTIVNTFNRVTALSYPVRQDRLSIFLSLTGGHGEHDIEVRIVRGGVPAGEKPLRGVTGKVNFVNPLHVAELTIDIRGMTIPAAGGYVIELLVDGDVLKQRHFEAVLLKSGGKKP